MITWGYLGVLRSTLDTWAYFGILWVSLGYLGVFGGTEGDLWLLGGT